MAANNDLDIAENLDFSTLELKEVLIENLKFLGYSKMMPIQAKSLPVILKGQDVIAQAKTGSGKTAAFGLSLLNRLVVEDYSVQALILCPTRELAEQVSIALRQLARLIPNVKVLNLSGGIPMRAQLISLQHSPHIIVGTPGRVQKHLDRGSFRLKSLKTLVLDEADRMLDMGFFDEIREIIHQCPKRRQTLLFSATYPAEIKNIAAQFMNNPKRILIKDDNTELDISQTFFEVSNRSKKFTVLKALLLHHNPSSALIFCNTKSETKEISNLLGREGFSATALNGDMEQPERDAAVTRFRNKSCSILVATDVAARGLDIKDLPAVINYDLAFDHEIHIHRIGRTGRAGSKGMAFSITTHADAQRLGLIEDSLADPIIWGTLSELDITNKKAELPQMKTISLNVGKKNKIGPGDILGALGKNAKIPGKFIGKIDVSKVYSYVAVHHSQIDKALGYLKHGKIKGCKVNARQLR